MKFRGELYSRFTLWPQIKSKTQSLDNVINRKITITYSFRVADGGAGLQIWRLAGNILNKQSWTDDQGWSSSLGDLA